MSITSQSAVKKMRCAIYTRKSTEEGLDQEYNSLEAQRDAAIAFIKSQKHEGWIGLDDEYNDGGFSGGNTNRPALKRLLEDVELGKIDVVVVYKIDRLSRSLADFAQIVAMFEKSGVTFVSVTQQFNTTTSMGRLTLNILLSFAQFEREVTGERIRDKIAASKAKGMWMGGVPPLGYDVVERKLIVNPNEAEVVREIFRQYAQHGSAATIVRQLQIEGRTTKDWVTKSGNYREGRVIDQQYIFTLLRNRVYIGEIVHKGAGFPGQHQPIIEAELWDEVAAIVAKRKRGSYERYTDNQALLAGILFATDGQRMLPTHTRKRSGRMYRYYVPYLEKRQRAGVTQVAGAEPLGHIPAADIENRVLEMIFEVLSDPRVVIGAFNAVRRMNDGLVLDEPSFILAMRDLQVVWEKLFPSERNLIVRKLLHRVQVVGHGLEVTWNEDVISAFKKQYDTHPFVQEDLEHKSLKNMISTVMEAA